MTGAMVVALGSACAGVFTNSKTFWELMHNVREFRPYYVIFVRHPGSDVSNFDFRQVRGQVTESGECLSLITIRSK